MRKIRHLSLLIILGGLSLSGIAFSSWITTNSNPSFDVSIDVGSVVTTSDYVQIDKSNGNDGISYLKYCEEGFINDYKYEKNVTGDKLTINLKYGQKKERVITGLKRVSKSGLRVYAKANEIPRVLNGLGIAIISTSKGLMTDKEARENNLGGEVLAYIW